MPQAQYVSFLSRDPPTATANAERISGAFILSEILSKVTIDIARLDAYDRKETARLKAGRGPFDKPLILNQRQWMTFVKKNTSARAERIDASRANVSAIDSTAPHNEPITTSKKLSGNFLPEPVALAELVDEVFLTAASGWDLRVK